MIPLHFQKTLQVCNYFYTVIWVFWIPAVAPSYRNTGAALCGAKLQFAVQVDISVFSRELEHVEREEVKCSLSVSLHGHRLVNRVRTSARTNRRWHHQHWSLIFITTDKVTVWRFFSHWLMMRSCCRPPCGDDWLVAQQESVTRATMLPSSPSVFSSTQIFWLSWTSVVDPTRFVRPEST